MEWTRATIRTTADMIEYVTGVLLSCGITGVQIIDTQEQVRFLRENTHIWDYAQEDLLEETTSAGSYVSLVFPASVIFYVTKDAPGKALLEEVQQGLRNLGSGLFNMQFDSADDQTWLHEWKKHFKPLHIGKVVIVPEWEKYEPDKQSDEIVFTIDPGSAFGTGQHQTTRLCIEALQDRLKPGDMLADIGCGSGILSVIGLLLGAEHVMACDIDPAGAMASTKKNAGLNPVDLAHLEIYPGDVLSDDDLRQKLKSRRYNIVVANIVADVIVDLTDFAREMLVQEGLFIASGIIRERLVDVLAAFKQAGLDVLETRELEDWCCVVGRKNSVGKSQA